MSTNAVVDPATDEKLEATVLTGITPDNDAYRDVNKKLIGVVK